MMTAYEVPPIGVVRVGLVRRLKQEDYVGRRWLLSGPIHV